VPSPTAVSLSSMPLLLDLLACKKHSISRKEGTGERTRKKRLPFGSASFLVKITASVQLLEGDD